MTGISAVRLPWGAIAAGLALAGCGSAAATTAQLSHAASQRGLVNGSAPRASHPQVRLTTQSAIPYRSCLIDGSSCSLTPCTEFTGQPSAEAALAYSRPPAARRRPRVTAARCVTYPHVRPHLPVFVAQ